MIRESRCVLLVCDRCAAVLAHPDTDSQIHYDTATAARADAVTDLDWSTAGGRDLCPSCTCTEQGHAWLAWWTPPARTAAPGLPPCRWCDRCGDVEIHDQDEQNPAPNQGGGLR